MSAEQPRTVVVPTADAGDVTITCPAWCTGHLSLPGDLRADIIHQGPDVALAFHGRHIGDAGLVQSPYASSPTPGLGGPTPGVSVSLLGQTLDPVALYELAACLDAHADQLRDLADQLARILGGEPR